MFQQILAVVVIGYFVMALFVQKKKKEISKFEFAVWLFFWLVTLLLIVFIKKIDLFVKSIGFSSTGIDFLMYLSVAILFYWLFKLRLKIRKMDSNLSKIVEEIAIINKNKNRYE